MLGTSQGGLWMDEHNWPAYDEYVRHMMGVYQVPGCSIAVAVDGQPVLARGYGWRDRENGLPATDQTVYGIGSCTKSLTAMAILQLEEEGALSIADPVVKYLPHFRVGKGDIRELITIHNFLTHTSGLPPLPSLYLCMARSMEGDPAAESILERIQEQKDKPIDTYEELMRFIGDLDPELLGPAGTHFSYSNDAYALLGAIVSQVSGQSYTTYVTERILKPLGMTRTTFDLKEMSGLPDVTTLYASKDDGEKEEVYASPKWWDTHAHCPAGFLRSNVTDLLRYLEVYRCGGSVGGRRVVSEKTIARMTAPHARFGLPLAYGYALSVDSNYHGVSVVGHSGGIKGVSAHILWVPEKGITGAALANLSGVPSGQILLGAVNLLLGLPVDTRQVTFSDYACPPGRLGRYVGEYRSGEGSVYEVSAQDGRLEVETQGRKLTARPVGADMFTITQKETETLLHFLWNAQGETYAIQAGSRIIRRAKPGVRA